MREKKKKEGTAWDERKKGGGREKKEGSARDERKKREGSSNFG
jgi:hypothetical protein